jgi:hypothetical protein
LFSIFAEAFAEASVYDFDSNFAFYSTFSDAYAKIVEPDVAF